MKRNSSEPLSPSREHVGEMFDRIAPRYDFLNRFLSMRQDVAWRKRVARFLPQEREISVLDIATGTGDLIFSLMDANSGIDKAVGVDISAEMLKIAKVKSQHKKWEKRDLTLHLGDAMALDFPDNSFDVVTIAFGIRNVKEISVALAEMYRVLKPGGKVLILEFSIPKNTLFRSLYLFYFRKVLPKIGSIVSGDAVAYSYLNRTVETFPYGEAFCALLEKEGFISVHAAQLSFGIASIYQGVKRNAEQSRDS